MKYLILLITPLLYADLDYSLPEQPWNYDQIRIDGKLIDRDKFEMRINFDRPTHKYYVAINTLDVLTTYHAVQRGYGSEANPLLPSDPSLTRLIAHKILWTEFARYGGIFWEEDEGFVYFANFLVTIAVINNTLIIIDNE
jgi:hypothetical protein